MLLFVYGTLKRGCRNHAYLAGAEFIGPAHTKPLYRLIDLGNYPGLVESPDGLSISGELYRVNSTNFVSLDDLEGDEYQRSPVALIDIAEPCCAYFYIKPAQAKPSLGSVWRDG